MISSSNFDTNTLIDDDALELLESHGIQILHVDGKAFVSLEDYNSLLRGLVSKIVSLTRTQNEEVMRVANSLEIIRETLTRNHPKVMDEVQDEINKHLRLS
ncbi:MAG: hypothetical protein OEW39_01020 [Deltaproteobacteria bacterium]|nr:hypothetical protein [Deltaproteobacteria bacterium]